MSKMNTRRNATFNYARVRQLYLPGRYACPWFQLCDNDDELQSDWDSICKRCGKTKRDHHNQYHKQHEAFRDR